MVECSPFRALVNEILVYDQAAIGADQFRSLIVADESMAPALWTFDGKLLKLIYLFFLALEPAPLFELLRLNPLYLSQLLDFFHLPSLPGVSSI
jgi:hypothetical protein